MKNDNDRTIAALRAALTASGSTSYRVAASPCCEAMKRVETSPGDATTLVGWLCPVHGLTVRADPASATAGGGGVRITGGAGSLSGQPFPDSLAGGGAISTEAMRLVSGPASVDAAGLPTAPPSGPITGGFTYNTETGQVFDRFGTAADATPPDVAAKPEHQAPWRWVDSSLDPHDDLSKDFLLDGSGGRILMANKDDAISIESPVARELIRVAPEMEALLRKHRQSGRHVDEPGAPCCPECHGFGECAEDCAWGAILAALEAARKATP